MVSDRGMWLVTRATMDKAAEKKKGGKKVGGCFFWKFHFFSGGLGGKEQLWGPGGGKRESKEREERE